MEKRWIVAGVAALLAPSLAIAAPGDLLVTEAEGGSVVEFGQGGDLSGVERFATGLDQPTGICSGPGSHIYVAETGSGEITIIDEGGDLSEEDPYAFGVVGIGSLFCDDERIVIACPLCNPNGIIQITQPGNLINTLELVAFNFPVLPGDMMLNAEGQLLSVAGDVYDTTPGGDMMGQASLTSGVTLIPGAAFGDVLVAGEFQSNRIFDITLGGELTDVTPFATLPVLKEGGVQALLRVEGDADYAVHGDEIYVIPDGGGDLTGASPVAFGLNTGLMGLQGMVRYGCTNDDECADADLCNGDELCVSNECQPAEGPPDCDDDIVCTADSCDAVEGCLNEPIVGCCEADGDCAVNELCDVANNQCVPTNPPGDDDGAESDDGVDGDSSGDGPDPDTGGPVPGDDDDFGGSGTEGGGSTGGEDAGADDQASGCSCRSDGTTAPPALLLLALLGLRRRRTA